MVPILCYPQTKSCQNIVVFIYFNSHLPYANYAIFTADRFPSSVPFAVRFGSCWYYGSDLLRFMSVRFVRFDSVHGDTEKKQLPMVCVSLPDLLRREWI